MLQNRVDPSGQIILTPARGSWMGNRGILHDDRQHILQPYKLKAWLICVLVFKDRKRPVMAPHRYTELFFYDEATAFSAGHRPCFECRRTDYNHFKACWIKGNPVYGFDERTSIKAIDDVLHRERIDPRGSKITYPEDLNALPDGVFVIYRGAPHLLAGGALYAWSPFGYGEALEIGGFHEVPVLTPRSTVNAFKAGYRPQILLRKHDGQ